MIKISAVGDIMPGGILSGVESGFISKEIIGVLSNADFRVGTLESAIGDNPTFFEEKMRRKADVIYSKIKDINKLKYLSIDIVSLANNHFYDLGVESADKCIKLLDEAGVKHVGAGRNLEEASRPVVESLNGKTIVFLAFCDWRDDTVGFCPFASETESGVNPMFDDYVVSEIKKYKKQSDYVVVLPHWGREHTWNTTLHVYKLAKKMIKAGADLILGSHPHRVQPVVNYRNGSVAFSMGNFLFPDRLIIKPRSTFYPDSVVDFDTLPVTYGYPFVEELTLKKWKPLGRIGMIVNSSFDGSRIHSSFTLTQLSERGSLSLLKSDSVERKLFFKSLFLRTSFYPLYYNLGRLVKSILRQIKCIID